MTWTSANGSPAVMVAGLPSMVVATDTEADDPSDGSVTVHFVSTGRSSMVVGVSPAGAAAMSMSRASPLVHDTCKLTAPCLPAAGPAIVFVTRSDDTVVCRCW